MIYTGDRLRVVRHSLVLIVGRFLCYMGYVYRVNGARSLQAYGIVCDTSLFRYFSSLSAIVGRAYGGQRQYSLHVYRVGNVIDVGGRYSHMVRLYFVDVVRFVGYLRVLGVAYL